MVLSEHLCEGFHGENSSEIKSLFHFFRVTILSVKGTGGRTSVPTGLEGGRVWM